MLSLATGYDVGYLTDAVGGGREGYYTGAVAAGEPPGLWYGAGAELLGLSGEVDAEQMKAIYAELLDPRDPKQHTLLGKAHKNYRSADEAYAEALKREPEAGPERRAQLRAQAERTARQPVAFLDATFSAPKSVSVLEVAFRRKAADARAAGDEQQAQAWDAHAQAVEDAVLAGAQAALDYLQDKAGYARVGHHGGGAGRWIDAHKFVVAEFLQHDSRDRDPQLHVHQAILNRVLCADGLWRALDSRAIHTWRAAAAAVGERVMEAHLARSLGVRFETRPDGKAREVVGIRQQVLDLFSSRRRVITAKAEALIGAFRERFGREPAPLERDRIARGATLVTRRGKSHHGEDDGERLDRWNTKCQHDVGEGLSEVADHVLDLAQQAEAPAQWSETDVIDRALERAGEARAAWSRSDLTRAISTELPGHLGLADPADVPTLLDGLTDKAATAAVVVHGEADTTNLPPEARRADGRSVFAEPGGERFATPGNVAAERALRAAAVRRGAPTLPADEVTAVIDRFAHAGAPLGADQAAAVRGVLTSGAWVEGIAAAAGTGKTFTLGAIRDAWQRRAAVGNPTADHSPDAARRVFALAPSQVATEVLAEDGFTARNTAAWLTTQARLDRARPREGDPDEGWRLRTGDLVMVDEAGMTTTDDLAAIAARCETAGAKLLLVGDPRQLAAVGPGGALADLAEHGVCYPLAEVRRFHHEWERDASLRLRNHDASALDDYQRHGRLVDAGTPEQAETTAARGWLADTLAGRESLLLVSSNEAAARTAAGLRAQLVDLGRVAHDGVALDRQGTVAGVGDLVQARRNGWELLEFDGNTTAPINRATYRVTALRADGGLTVAPILDTADTPATDRSGDATTSPADAEQLGAPLQLPSSYVTADLTLGYASTVHAAQGRTVDTAHAVIGPGSAAAGAYVAMTRGRERNTAYAVTRKVADDAPTGATHEVAERPTRAVLADLLDGAEREASALAQQGQAEHDAASTLAHGDQLIAVVAEQAIAGRTAALLDRLTTMGALDPEDRRRLAADDALDSVQRLLRRAELAGHDSAEALATAVDERGFDDARAPAQALYRRLADQLRDQLAPNITSYTDLIPVDDTPEQWRAWLVDRAAAADQRRRELGTMTAEQAPQWAREALGSVPDEPVARAEWERAAGWAASWRELATHTDTADPLGPAPPAGLVDKHAVWRTAHAALDLPDRGDEEAALSDGRLRMRVRAMEREQVWAPRYVGDELDATEQAAARHRADAQVWAARAENTSDLAERETLRAAADQAQQRAGELAERVAGLEAADHARAVWYAETAATRDAAERARAELAARGIDLDAPDERVTADEWLAAHRADQAAEDAHREITDKAQLHDPAHEVNRAAVLNDFDAAADEQPIAETAVPDLRESSTPHATERAAGDDRAARRWSVPSADETTAAVTRAQAALAEVAARRRVDEARQIEEAEARREGLTRWAGDDQAAEQQPDHRRERDDAPVLQ